MTELLTTAEAAALAGVLPASWAAQARRTPALRDAKVMLDGRTPAWPREVVETWLRTRPGRGARTDLREGTP